MNTNNSNNNSCVKEELIPWQPTKSLKGNNTYDFNMIEMERHNDYLKISFEDHYGNIVDVFYRDLNNLCPLEYCVWAFRYSTELGSIHLNNRDIKGVNVDQDSVCFYKAKNSVYVSEFDENPIANKVVFPEVEHHLFITGDEIFEVIANYEPEFVERKK
ncbi:hypothetical protein [Bacillus suaedae]|uniref:Uncharacterized protein n=1 Tax=Halalkalibacter suaedae TaxID=2822140 RepID=A0A940WWV1_9BACI|nr:hypothetical protein [Bacillus suaedae]MBP3951873.1 hypothetical protein [Bacillus suaedae]